MRSRQYPATVAGNSYLARTKPSGAYKPVWRGKKLSDAVKAIWLAQSRLARNFSIRRGKSHLSCEKAIRVLKSSSEC